MKPQKNFQNTLIMVIACLLPIFILFFLASTGVTVSPIIFFLFFLIGCALMFYMMGYSHNQSEDAEANDTNNTSLAPEEQSEIIPQYINDVFETSQAYKSANYFVFEGKFLTD